MAASKLTVEFNPKMTALLEDLAEEKDTSKVDVIRRAVALYKYLEDEKSKGNTVAIADRNASNVLKEIVLP